MKGIVLAAGSGTRFYPATLVISKQLLPLYDKPLIYYPLAVLMQAGIRDVMIIVTEHDLARFEQLLGDGARLGISIRYRIQPEPLGIPDVFRLATDFIDDEPIALILSDNVIYGDNLGERIAPLPAPGGLTLFAHPVDDPQNYGVFEFAEDGTAIGCVDKPAVPASSYAAIGLYLCDPSVVDIAKALTPLAQGELEMDDMVRPYFEQGRVEVRQLEDGYAWFDTGTPERLYTASRFVREIEGRLGIKIACLEEIALAQGFIGRAELAGLLEPMTNSLYGRYLERLLKVAG